MADRPPPTRSEVHRTTTVNGVYNQDPKGLHVTFCYKDKYQMDCDTHVAYHGYVDDPEILDFREANTCRGKLDTMKKNKKDTSLV